MTFSFSIYCNDTVDKRKEVNFSKLFPRFTLKYFVLYLDLIFFFGRNEETKVTKKKKKTQEKRSYD